MPLLVVVRFVVDDSHGAVNLFRKNESNHLMRESHTRKRDFFMCALVYPLRKTIRSANDKDQTLQSHSHFLFHP